MILRNGSGDEGPTSLYVSALALVACVPVVRLLSAADPDTFVDLKLNGIQLQRSGASGGGPLTAPVDLAPGDEFEFSVSNSDSGAWEFEFRLYPQGDVAYEAP